MIIQENTATARFNCHSFINDHNLLINRIISSSACQCDYSTENVFFVMGKIMKRDYKHFKHFKCSYEWLCNIELTHSTELIEEYQKVGLLM